MFDIGWSELLLIGGVALVVIGPKDLPRALRTLGQTTTKLRRMAADFQRQFNEAMREADMEEFRKGVSDVVDTARDLKTNFNPMDRLRNEIKGAIDDADPRKPLASVEVPSAGDYLASLPPPPQAANGDEALAALFPEAATGDAASKPVVSGAVADTPAPRKRARKTQPVAAGGAGETSKPARKKPATPASRSDAAKTKSRKADTVAAGLNQAAAGNSSAGAKPLSAKTAASRVAKAARPRLPASDENGVPVASVKKQAPRKSATAAPEPATEPSQPPASPANATPVADLNMPAGDATS